jgi:hypothetical protein
VKVGSQELTFFVDRQTHLEVRPAARELQRAQTSHLRVSNFFEPGQVVLVRYRNENGRNHALDIARVGSAGGGSVSEAQKTSDGRVTLVTASQLTIDDNGREFTFVITGDTDVIARGASTATRAAGGSTPITTFVHTGDTVSVRYRDVGAKMMASEVRVKAVYR